MSNENIFETLAHLTFIPESNQYPEDGKSFLLPLIDTFPVYNHEPLFQDAADMVPALIPEIGALNLTSSLSSSTSSSSVLTEPSSYEPTLTWRSSGPYFEPFNNQLNSSSGALNFEGLTISSSENVSCQRNRLHNVTNRATKVPPVSHHLLNSKSIQIGTIKTNESQIKERRHACDICGRLFKRTQELDRHQFCHTGERRFFCNHPGCQSKGFTRKDALIRHTRCHKNIKRVGRAEMSKKKRKTPE
ncbi:unnamed protein product [Rhizopus stolonifer]